MYELFGKAVITTSFHPIVYTDSGEPLHALISMLFDDFQESLSCVERLEIESSYAFAMLFHCCINYSVMRQYYGSMLTNVRISFIL